MATTTCGILSREAISEADLNEVVEVKLKTASPLAYDAYSDIRESGGAILVDQTSFVTVGAALLQ